MKKQEAKKLLVLFMDFSVDFGMLPGKVIPDVISTFDGKQF